MLGWLILLIISAMVITTWNHCFFFSTSTLIASKSGSPPSQPPYCPSTSIFIGPLLLQHLPCFRTSTVAEPPKSQHLKSHRSSPPITFTVPVPLWQELHLSLDLQGRRNCTVLGPQILQDFKCYRTCTVVAPPLSQDHHP